MVGQTLCHVLFVCLVSSSLGLAANVVQGRDPAAADPPAVEAAGAELSAQSKAAADAIEWHSLFDGKTLGSWKSTAFGGEGEVTVEEGAIQIAMGSDMSGITWTEKVPRQHYEISVEAQRVEGTDFFCGLTFPVGDDPCSFIVGGWGGGVIGLSTIDGQDAANNSTTQFQEFQRGRWYAVRVRVSPERIECFLDDERVVDQLLRDRIISIRDEVIPSKPLGIATYATTARLKNIRWRNIAKPSGQSEEGKAD
ncbi:MAG: DUF1080 domain-containing protein [Planctomycetota bacterium]